jgi:hypothetical protein
MFMLQAFSVPLVLRVRRRSPLDLEQVRCDLPAGHVVLRSVDRC